MLRSSRLLGTFLLSLLGSLLPLLHAAASFPEKLPSTPITDQARLFDKDSPTFTQLNAAFQKIETEHRYPVRIFLCDSLIGSNPQSEALRLQQAWLPNGNGWIIVAEIDSRRIGFGQPFLLSPKDPANPGNSLHQTGLSQAEQELVLSQLVASLRPLQRNRSSPPADPTTFAETLCQTLAAEIDSTFRRRTTNADSTVDLRILLFTVGLAATAALVALITWKSFQHSQQRQSRRYHFPEIQVASRLGAPYGGGRINSRNFLSPPPHP